MDYASARREARKLLGSKAELQHFTSPVLQFRVGVRGAVGFVLMGVGSTWVEAINDVRRQLRALGGANGENGEEGSGEEASGESGEGRSSKGGTNRSG